MSNVVEILPIIQGKYERNNKNLVNSTAQRGATLVIGTRKNPTPSKPINYLLSKVGKKYQYITSMYPTLIAGHYKLEYNGKCYDMLPTDSGYTITETAICR
jgi:hypothetical protein